MSDANNFSNRLKENSNDEIGMLSKAINGMLDKIVAAEQGEDALSRKVRTMNAEVEKRIQETEKMNQMMVERDRKMVELRKEIENIKSHDPTQ